MHDAARIVDARPSIQSGKFRAGKFDVGCPLARNLQRLEAPLAALVDRKARALPRFVISDNSMGPEEK
jgi:hypothetical protein